MKVGPDLMAKQNAIKEYSLRYPYGIGHCPNTGNTTRIICSLE